MRRCLSRGPAARHPFSKAICIGLNYETTPRSWACPSPPTRWSFSSPPPRSWVQRGNRQTGDVHPPRLLRLSWRWSSGKRARFVLVEEGTVVHPRLQLRQRCDGSRPPAQDGPVDGGQFDTFCPYGPFISDEVDPPTSMSRAGSMENKQFSNTDTSSSPSPSWSATSPAS